MPSLQELQMLQALPLEVKIRKTEQRIKEWVETFGEDGVYISFSGGKDSTVLLHIARNLYPNLKAVFVDVPTQYPELREFAQGFKNVDIIKPKHLWKYARETGRKPIIATMASESRLRTQKWIQNGCNGFDLKEPTSNPLSFWTEQDILLYIKLFNIPICSVYGEIVEDRSGTDAVEGQLTMSDCFADAELFDAKRLPLTTTGCKRTGCMLCGFGCHLEKSPNRFEMLKETHPKMYELLDVVENNGVTFREAIDWINENGNMNIKY